MVGLTALARSSSRIALVVRSFREEINERLPIWLQRDDTSSWTHAAVFEHGRHASGECVELREAVFPLLEGERHPLTHVALAPSGN